MTALVKLTRQEGVGVLALANPPVNSLGAPLRRDLARAFAALAADPLVHAIVLVAGGRSFAAGPDLRDLAAPEATPTLGDLCLAIEACAKPVVAALHGPVLGPGLELALAAHYRLALATAQFGFPDVTLALMPAAGGTQRAPRLIGAGPALRLMLSGQPIPARDAAALGLIDRVVDKDVAVEAYLLARTRPAVRPTMAETRHLALPQRFEAAVAAARSALRSDPPSAGGPALAPLRIIDAVEAALLLPPDRALAFEQAASADCVASEASTGLRHAFVAERRIAKFPEAQAKPRPVQTIGIVGAGQIGAALAHAVIASGMHCIVVEKDRPALIKALEAIATAQERAVEAGHHSAGARDADWARISGSADLAALHPADLVIEALPESLALKLAVLEQLGAALRPGVLVATTTEALDLAALAEATGRPEDVFGFHLSLPLPMAQLIEIGVTAATAADAVASGAALAARLRRPAVRVRARDGQPGGLIAARLANACWQAGKVLARRGVTPQDVAAALASIGQSDLIVSMPQPGASQPGASQPGAPQPGGSVSPGELQRRCLAAMTNEAARILADGMAQRPSDIDMVSILGLGLPRWRGGLMQMADRRGILALRLDLAEFAADDPALWAPHPLILDMFKNGRLFGEMNVQMNGQMKV